MFVFGMNVLEDSIKSLGYQSLRKRLSHNVNNRIRAMFAGTVLAGILQSGTIVSTMVVAFAGAGILTLTAGIGIIV
jgi:phosphate:Na+ symporter